IGLSSAVDAPSVLPLGLDLYDGLPGVVLFLAYLGHLTGDQRYTDLARRGLTSLQRQLAGGAAQLKDVGAFSGWGGLIYTFTELGALWDAPDLFDAASTCVERAMQHVGADTAYDVASGAAGCVGALLALYCIVPSV